MKQDCDLSDFSILDIYFIEKYNIFIENIINEVSHGERDDHNGKNSNFGKYLSEYQRTRP